MKNEPLYSPYNDSKKENKNNATATHHRHKI